MAEHLTEERLELFRRNKLSPADLLLVDDHLAGCEECRAAAVRTPELVAAGASLQRALTFELTTSHLTYSQLEGYVDGTSDVVDMSHCDAHIAICAACRSEVEELRPLRSDVASQARQTAPSRPAFADRIRGLFSVRSLAIAATLMAVLVLGWIALRNRVADTSSGQVVANTVSPPETPQILNANTQAPTPEIAAVPPTTGQGDSSVELATQLLDGGEQVGLSTSGALVGYANVPAPERQKLERILRTGELQFGDVRDLRSASGPAMGDPDVAPHKRFELRGPIGKVLLTDRPTLSWESLEGADSYVVDLFDTNFNKAASSGPVRTNTWTPRLARGNTYIWQVTASKNGQEIRAPQRPAPEARFRIVGGVQASAIMRARSKRPNSHLLLGTLYAEAGMLNEAVAEFETLARENPRSKLAHNLAATVRKDLDRSR